jgi:hypothetical protein
MTARHAGGLAAAIAAALVVALATTALANRVVVRDPRGDTAPGLRSDLDIRKAIAAHARQGRLKHVVKVQRATGNTARALQIHLRARGRRYTIFGSGVGTTPVYVVRKSGATTGKTTGTATVRRRGKRVIFTFDRQAIGSPGAYRWAVAANPNPGIYRGKHDRAPNKGFKRHRLG